MDTPSLLAVALGLAVDAFSVSVVYELKSQGGSGEALKMASSFGFFQAFMPVLGWFAGLEVLNIIAEFDHWLAFILLLIAGCRMIYESTKDKSIEKPLSLYLLLSLSIATSIDALAVGLSLAFLRVSIYAPVFVISTVTFALSFLGGLFGAKLGRFFSARIEGLAGLILIGIGIKILLEHLG